MDKSLYCRRKQYKLLGRLIWEVIHDYEGIDLENIEPVNPIIMPGNTRSEEIK